MKLYKLDNQVKHYLWGSPEWIPRLVGKENPENTPWAELWMGVHGEGPSEIAGEKLTLEKLIAGDPGKFLGTARDFGNLPFLLKILAAASPLSVQAHPDLENAKRGWAEENKNGVPEQKRNYRDPNHKPEIICALTPFTAMAGFRDPAEAETLIRAFFSRKPALGDRLRAALEGGYRAFLSAVFGLGAEERRLIRETAGGTDPAKVPAGPEFSGTFALCAKLAEAYPDDPGILSPLYLNLVELRPFQAIYLPAGILHSYVYGLGVECMANSDNVLRCGLTPKNVDLEELFRILRFEPYRPETIRGEIPEGKNLYRYRTPFREFALFRLDPGASEAALEENGAAIALVTHGEISLSLGNDTLLLKQGESAFIPFRNNSRTLVARAVNSGANPPPGETGLFVALVPEP
ncbi:MAG: mannose-6-phosphate isomerase, class I [Treponema sp.]|jgi:mannose-6-phosphate isomerase|nr:mannose-6-phosphate isomerase, class I [Treponema sp.]